MKQFLIALLLPIAANAQLALVTVSGSTETPVGSIYDYGQVAAGTVKSVHFRVHNNGTTAATITTLSASGAGFTISAPTIPYAIAPGLVLDFTVNFSAATPASYSASLAVNTINTFLLATAVAFPTLAASSGCTGTNPIDFGRAQQNTTETCNLTLTNPYSTAVSLSSAVVTGTAFSGPNGLPAPTALNPGQSITFSINFTPPGPITYTGSLTLGPQTFSLTGQGYLPPLPKPTLTFDAGAPASGQQRTITMTIPGGSPINATGSLNLAFNPLTAAVTKDPAIFFLANGTQSIPFSIKQGDTQALLGGLASAAFQTGTTEGTITFTVRTSAVMSGDPTVTMTIPGTAIVIDSTAASNQRLGELDVTVVGVDNTYSAGVLSFTFFDANGNLIGGVVNADFTSAFKSYFAGSTVGGAFRMLVSFPVVGTQTQVATVQVMMTNAAGQVNTGRLTFQ